MVCEVSLDTMRSLRLNQVLSASLWQFGPVEAAALMSSPRVVLGGTRSVPNHDWSMERQGAIMGTVFPRSHMESPIVQYLQQRQDLKKSSSTESPDPATRFIPGVSRSPDPDQLPNPSHARTTMEVLTTMQDTLGDDPTPSQSRQPQQDSLGDKPTPGNSKARHFAQD
jgi:hypothetical protein